MALCSLGRNGKPEYYYYYKHSKTDRQELSKQAHRKMRDYNKELIRQEYNDYMNEAEKVHKIRDGKQWLLTIQWNK